MSDERPSLSRVLAVVFLAAAAAACRNREAARGSVVVRTATPLLDLNSFALADARLAGGGEGLGGTVAIWMPLKPEGSRALEAWSTTHAAERLGVFLRGKLVEAPQVQSRIGSGIPLQVPKAEADRVLKELAGGGSAE